MVTGTLPGRQEVGHVDPAVVGRCVGFGGRTHPLQKARNVSTLRNPHVCFRRRTRWRHIVPPQPRVGQKASRTA